MFASRTPLAWRNTVHDKVTLLVSVTAMAFAVLIMFMELGFLNGLYDSQTAALELLDADLIMAGRALHILNTHETFPRSRLEQVAASPGVKRTTALYVEDRFSELRNPDTGVRNGIRVFALDPNEGVFASHALNSRLARLRVPLTILFDKRSRSFFGRLHDGVATEIADRTVTVVGTFDLGPDYYYDGNVLTSADTFFTLFPHQRRDHVFLGIIQLERSASSGSVLRELRRTIRDDVDLFTKRELIAREKAKWQQSTPAGDVFTIGVAVGFVIGVFICYQILYTDITNHLPQLATLKAIGYLDRTLIALVLKQAVGLGILGFLPAIGMTAVLYSVLSAVTGIITRLTFARLGLIFVLTISMCVVAALLAVRKALAADPAELF